MLCSHNNVCLGIYSILCPSSNEKVNHCIYVYCISKQNYLAIKKKKTTDLHHTIQYSQKYYSKGKEPDMEDDIIYDSLY